MFFSFFQNCDRTLSAAPTFRKQVLRHFHFFIFTRRPTYTCVNVFFCFFLLSWYFVENKKTFSCYERTRRLISLIKTSQNNLTCSFKGSI